MRSVITIVAVLLMCGISSANVVNNEIEDADLATWVEDYDSGQGETIVAVTDISGPGVRFQASTPTSTSGWTTTAVRSGEGLMQVIVAQVKSPIPCSGDPQDAVRIGLIIAAQTPHLMNEVNEFIDPRVVYPGVFRIGDQQRSSSLGEGGFQCPRFRVAIFIRIQGNYLIACYFGAGSIRGVREDGRDHLIALLSFVAGGMISPDHGHIGIDRSRSSSRLQGEAIHAGDLFEQLLQPVHDFQDPLNRDLILQRVEINELGRTGELVVDLRAVFHRTGALPDIDVQINA